MLQTSVDIKILVPIVWADRKARVTSSSFFIVAVVVAGYASSLLCHVMVGRMKVASESMKFGDCKVATGYEPRVSLRVEQSRKMQSRSRSRNYYM